MSIGFVGSLFDGLGCFGTKRRRVESNLERSSNGHAGAFVYFVNFASSLLDTLQRSLYQAWAARFSDHPAIVGVGAPRLSELGTRQDLTQYGIARDSFAVVMLERALKEIDVKGALRKPSGVCAGALVLLEFLVSCKQPTCFFLHRTQNHILTTNSRRGRCLSYQWKTPYARFC